MAETSGDDARRAVHPGDLLPLTWQQRICWFQSVLDPSSPRYDFHALFHFMRPPPLSALRATLAGTLRRHPATRVKLVIKGGEAFQVVPPDEVADDELDITETRLDVRPSSSRDLVIASGAVTPFDLTTGPLLRWALVHLPDGTARLVHSEHHIIHDGMSFLAFLDSLGDVDAPSDYRYFDYAATQQRPTAEELKRAVAVCAEADLSDFSGVSSGPRAEDHFLRLQIPDELFESARRAAGDLGVSLFTVLFAGFSDAVARHQQKQHLVVGTAIHNRPEGHYETVAMYVSMTPVVVDYRGVDGPEGQIRSASVALREAIGRADIPVQDIVRELGMHARQGKALISTAFNMHRQVHETVELAGQTASVEVGVFNGAAKFPINVIALVTGDTEPRMVELLVEGDAGKIGEHDLWTVWQHLLDWLGELTPPAATMGGSARLSHAAGAELRFPDGDRIDKLVFAQAARNADAIALRLGGEDRTYADLVAAADRAAVVLHGAGVRCGDVVAVRARCTLDVVGVLLGCLRAGAAYTIVPREWPRQRYEQLAARTGLRVCISDEDDNGPPVPAIRVISVAEASSSQGDDTPPGGASNVPGAGADADAACVFLTSGSTGEPKAVLVSHRGIARLAFDPTLTVPGQMTTYQVGSVAWDAFAWELWTPLIRGGTCVLSGGARATGSDVRAAVAEGVNGMLLNTVLFNALVDDDIDSLHGLKLLITGGERNSSRHLRRCRDAHPGMRVVHAYGPAEGSVITTSYTLPPGEVRTNVPVGQPVVNTEVWLLDEERRPVRAGAVGEMAIAGDSLAIGYLGADEETTVRFPTLELGGVSRRIYLTGDLARFEPDGELVFVGRRDRQVKIRGARIEPEEVEAVIEKVPGTGRAVVVGLPVDALRKTHLAAFVSSERVTSPPPAEAVRQAVANALPTPFVPQHVVTMQSLPKLPTGKVDMKALLAMLPKGAGEPASMDGAVESSAAPLAVALRVVAEVLGRPVAPDDDLMDAGADSLASVRIATRLARMLGHSVREADVLEARTVRRLVDAVA